eukprot:754649-Prymnesium_polylepis.1
MISIAPPHPRFAWSCAYRLGATPASHSSHVATACPFTCRSRLANVHEASARLNWTAFMPRTPRRLAPSVSEWYKQEPSGGCGVTLPGTSKTTSSVVGMDDSVRLHTSFHSFACNTGHRKARCREACVYVSSHPPRYGIYTPRPTGHAGRRGAPSGQASTCPL